MAMPSGDVVTSVPLGFDGDGWMPHIAGTMNRPLMWRESGWLCARALSDTTNTFGWWQSPEMSGIEPGTLYRAIFDVSTNVWDPSRAPFLRLRLKD